MRAPSAVTFVLLAGLCFTSATYSQTKASSEPALQAGRAAIQQGHYAEAIHLLEDAQRKSPNDRNLKVELGRAYLYNHQDDRAKQLFREILRDEPSNRVAKLELARALGYQRDYAASNVLYRELLSAGPDEAAEVGLVRNLMHQHNAVEARRELEEALVRFPQSQQLKEYRQKLAREQARPRRSSRNGEPRPAALDTQERLMGTVAYLSDSAGNRSWRSTQSFNYEFARNMANNVQMEERTLWQAAGPKANVMWATDDLRLRPTSFLGITAGGGAVRFANGSSRALYRGELELHPMKGLWLTGGFSRNPVAPTVRATQFNLLAEGWRTRLDWNPRGWRTHATWSGQHYSDGNRAQRVEAETIRWFGTSHFAIATGYRFNYIGFTQTLLHGYFNPRRYQSHLGITGVKLGLGEHFRGEYLVHVGGESVVGAPYQTAWDFTLRNRFLLQKWELGGDYSYFHLAQNTGAFKAQSARFVAAFRF
jgi:tetratricopeptide (TPR) repeat protein